MNYLKIQWTYVTSVAWRLAPLAARGAAISLLGYCFRAENSGRIAGCAQWAKERWMATADIGARDVQAVVAAGLARWEGDDLVVEGYDLRGEKLLTAQRQQAEHGAKGKEFGKLGGRPGKKPPEGVSEKPPQGVIQNPLVGDCQKPPQSNPIQSNPVCVARDAHAPTRAAREGDTHTRDGIQFELASRGLKIHPEAVAEWETLLAGPLIEAIPENFPAALRMLLAEAHRRGVVVRFASDVAQVAADLARQRAERAERRARFEKPPAEPAKPIESRQEARARRLRGELNPIERAQVPRWRVNEDGDWVRADAAGVAQEVVA